MFADRQGALHSTKQRRLFTVIDGIVGGENKGPLEPDPKHSGVLIASENFLAADIVGTRLMGFDPMKIKTLANLLGESEWDYGVRDYSDINIRSRDESIRDCLGDTENKFFDYKPYPGWVGHIEI